MTSATAQRLRPVAVDALQRVWPPAVTIALCFVITVGFSGRIESVEPWQALLGLASAGLAGYCLFSTRLEISLAALFLYLVAIDGYFKLSTGSELATLGRDVLLYSIVSGVIVRHMAQGKSFALPPLGGWVLAFIAVVAIQLFNPHNASLTNSLAGVRPHLEFVPLFFLGYLALRTPRRLELFLLLLVLGAALNGVVGFVQTNLTSDQLAAWGPGYSDFINGTGAVSGRVYYVEGTEEAVVRPFGLGGDTGAGGLVGLCAVGAAMALITTAARKRVRLAALIITAGIPLAIFTSQSRGVIVGSIIAGLAYLAYTTTPRRLIPALLAGVLAVVVTGVVVSYVSVGTGDSVFERYRTISPRNLLETTQKDRGNSLNRLPELVADYPLGGGIASVGPGSAFGGGARQLLDGETLFTLYVSSLGIPGLFLILGLYLKLVFEAGARLRAVIEPRLRAMLAAVLAPIAGLLSTAFAGGALVASPTAPYFWTAAGIASFWLFSSESPVLQSRRRRLVAPVGTSAADVRAPGTWLPGPSRELLPRRDEGSADRAAREEPNQRVVGRRHITMAVLTRNRPDHLQAALKALQEADPPPDDVVVSDDSDEAHVQRNRELVEGVPGARYVRGPRRGLGANENHIVTELSPATEWVVFTGDDARVPPQFFGELAGLLAKHAPHSRIPTGSEIRNGVWVEPRDLSFFGFQERSYPDYSPGAEVQTVVVQATAFPAEYLRQVRWLEVSAYGYDEVDMAAKMRRLGWTFAYEPTLWLYHDQAEEGREEYPAPVQIARLYFRLRSLSVYSRRPIRLMAFAILAPMHLILGALAKGRWRQLREAPRSLRTAYSAWWRSLREDWRTT